jgi:hypothetical protein
VGAAGAGGGDQPGGAQLAQGVADARGGQAGADLVSGGRGGPQHGQHRALPGRQPRRPRRHPPGASMLASMLLCVVTAQSLLGLTVIWPGRGSERVSRVLVSSGASPALPGKRVRLAGPGPGTRAATRFRGWPHGGLV